MGDVDKIKDSTSFCSVKNCRSKPKLIVLYNGAPTKNYSVILCAKHASEHPFNQNILKITLLEENN